MMELKDLVAIAKEVAEENEGEHQPQFYFEVEGRIEMYLVPFESEDDKYIFVERVLPALVESKNVDAYFAVFGAWMSQNKQPPTGKRVSDMDTKQEIIIASKYTRTGTYTAICPFTRAENNKLIWGEEIWMDPEQASSFDKFNVWVKQNIIIRKEDLS